MLLCTSNRWFFPSFTCEILTCLESLASATVACCGNELDTGWWVGIRIGTYPNPVAPMSQANRVTWLCIEAARTLSKLLRIPLASFRTAVSAWQSNEAESVATNHQGNTSTRLKCVHTSDRNKELL